MKKVILFFLLCVTNVLWSQINNQTARRIFRVVALPITCNPADIVYKIGASAGYYLCTATDTWTLLGITGGGGVWGGITGTLSDQTDLQSALDAKASLAGATFTGGIITPVGTTTVRQFKLTPGVCLTSPNNGDFCYRSSDDKVRFYSAAAWGTVAKEEDLAALPTETGILRKTTAGTTPPITLTAGTTVSIAEGGTGQTAATDDAIAIYNGTGTDLKVIPDCTDTGGNHLNYTQSTNVLSCGTSGGSSATKSLWTFNTTTPTTVAGAATTYGVVDGMNGSPFSTTESTRQVIIAAAGHLTGITVLTTTSQPSNGAFTFTVRTCTPTTGACTGSDSAVTCNVAASGAAGGCSADGFNVAFAKGDLLSVKFANAGSTSAAIQSWSIAYTVP